jgi:hypothetical protein
MHKASLLVEFTMTFLGRVLFASLHRQTGSLFVSSFGHAL